MFLRTLFYADHVLQYSIAYEYNINILRPACNRACNYSVPCLELLK